jgi:hypothetical protein
MREPIKLVERVVNLQASGDVATFAFPRAGRVVRVGIVVTSAADANSAANVVVDFTQFGAARGDADGGTIVLPASAPIGTAYVKRHAASLAIGVGGIIAFQSTAQATNAMTGIAFVEYHDGYENEGNTTGDVLQA